MAAGKPYIDFNVHSDPYWIRVADYSTWMLIKNKPSIIEILLPGSGVPVVKFFDKNKTNGFNSINLEINCVGECGETDPVTLSDGVYKITVKGSPSKFKQEKHYLKTDLLQMELDKIYISSIDNNKYSKVKDTLTTIEFLLKGAEAHLRMDNIRMAGNMFQKAVEMTEDLKDCKDCYEKSTGR